MVHPAGHSTGAEVLGHAASGAQTASQAHDELQRTPAGQLPTPVHATEHAFTPQRAPNAQLLSPVHAIEQLDASAQSSEPQESTPRQ